jgi:hypothetical protein
MITEKLVGGEIEKILHKVGTKIFVTFKSIYLSIHTVGFNVRIGRHRFSNELRIHCIMTVERPTRIFLQSEDSYGTRFIQYLSFSTILFGSSWPKTLWFLIFISIDGESLYCLIYHLNVPIVKFYKSSVSVKFKLELRSLYEHQLYWRNKSYQMAVIEF